MHQDVIDDTVFHELTKKHRLQHTKMSVGYNKYTLTNRISTMKLCTRCVLYPIDSRYQEAIHTSINYLSDTMSLPYKHLLNMENLEPVKRLVQELTENIEKNDEVLASIARSIDSKLCLPSVPNVEEPQSEESPVPDPLKALIESKYLPEKKEENDKFASVLNPRLRQLLIDNEALLKLHKAKVEQNKQLFQIYQEYEELIKSIVLPQLAKVVYEYNIEKVAYMREKTLEDKLELDGKVWEKYIEYVENLDKIYGVVLVLVEALQGMDGKDLQRLEQQLLIVGRLAEVAKQRTREFKRPMLGGKAVLQS